MIGVQNGLNVLHLVDEGRLIHDRRLVQVGSPVKLLNLFELGFHLRLLGISLLQELFLTVLILASLHVECLLCLCEASYRFLLLFNRFLRLLIISVDPLEPLFSLLNLLLERFLALSLRRLQILVLLL